MRLCVMPILLVAAAYGCTNSDLYANSGANPLVPDRIALTGEICTEDTASSAFPVKVLFLVDTSIGMRNADPQQNIINGPTGIQALVASNSNQLNVSFGFVGFDTSATAFPRENGQAFLTPQDTSLISQALAELSTTGARPERDITTAITEAEAFIAADVSRTEPGAILRTRYVVYLLVAGPANPDIDATILANAVATLRDTVYGYGALEFQLNIGLPYFGPKTTDQGTTENFNCFDPLVSPPSCDCAAPVAGDYYCLANCALALAPSPTFYDDQYAEAQTLYQNLKTVGNGTLTTWNCPTSINIQLPIASGAVNLVRKDIVAFNANVHIAPTGDVLDSDGDGLIDDEETSTIGTDPFNKDTDNDGVGDGVESRSNKNPLDPTDRPDDCQDPAVVGPLPDTDLDLLNDCEEGVIQTSPSKPDTDGDGLTDFVEFMSGTLPTNPNDRLLDFDSDGYLNGEEVLAHTDPRVNESAVRGVESYRTGIDTIGLTTVSSMEDPPDLDAVTFIQGSGNLAPGQATLSWDAAAQTLSWVDAHSSFPPFWTPTPVHIKGSGTYRLTASAPNGENGYVDVAVDVSELPTNSIIVYPLISVADRNCYNVRISNIKLMQTGSHDEGSVGINNVYVFFTQAPSDRLTQPGIAEVADIQVVFRCTNTKDLSTCARNPADAEVVLTSGLFKTAD